MKHISLNYVRLDQYFGALCERIQHETSLPFRSFSHIFMQEHEEYKVQLRDQALVALGIQLWSEDLIGTGEIIRRLIAAIEQPNNNFFVHQVARFGEKGIAHRFLYEAQRDTRYGAEVERLTYDFFKDRIVERDAFESYIRFAGRKYAPLAYIFFLKDDRKYMPIAPGNFDKIFSTLEIDFVTSKRCSWDNYETFNALINEIKVYLESRMEGEVRLIDAHSFLWTLGWAVIVDHRAIPIPLAKEIVPTAPSRNIADELAIQEPTYGNAVDFLQRQREQHIIGRKSEEFVFRSEQQRLLAQGRDDLAQQIEIVGEIPGLGYDVRSFDEDGTERQIEVKTIRTDPKGNSFFLSQNELEKSKTLPNYFIYLVERSAHGPTAITYVHKPNFEDEYSFEVKPATYVVSYKQRQLEQ